MFQLSKLLIYEKNSIVDNMVGKYKVITLCGSTRFKEQFFEAQKRLTLEGNIVISVGLFGHSGDDEVWTEGTKEMLDDMHKRKIDMADEIFVINVGCYIGSSTRSEIEYAKKHGKVVRYLESVEEIHSNSLGRYIEQLTSLKTAKIMSKNAPHKAVMLVSVIDMIQAGLISGEEIYFTEGLQRMFKLNWGRYVGESLIFKPVPATPFWHLGNEPFWTLQRKDGGKIDDVKNTPSGGALTSMGIFATIDKELIALLKDESTSDKLRGLLVDKYLSHPKPQIKRVLPFVVGMVATRLFV